MTKTRGEFWDARYLHAYGLMRGSGRSHEMSDRIATGYATRMTGNYGLFSEEDNRVHTSARAAGAEEAPDELDALL